MKLQGRLLEFIWNIYHVEDELYTLPKQALHMC